MKKIALLGAMALSLLSPLAAIADDAKPLRIGIEAAYPPFAFKTPDGKIDLAEAAKMTTSCGTMAIRCRTSAGSASRRFTPSSRTPPFSGS